MVNRQGFWIACESLPGPAALELHWRQLAGEDYDAAKAAFLRPMQELATYYPCTRSHPCGCYHHVVIHSDEDIVAVCTCDPEECDKIRITKSDIIVYELDRPKLHMAIAETLSLEPKEAEVPYLRQTTQIGVYSPHVGCHLPALVTMSTEPPDFQHVVFGLAANSHEPFVLIAPTGRPCGPDCLELLDRSDSLFVALSDLLVFDRGNVAVNKECVDAFIESCRKKARLADHKTQAARPATAGYIPERVFHQEDDFRTVWLHGKQLEKLTVTQAQIVKVLYEAAQRDRPEMLFAAIALRLMNPPGKMSNVFRKADSRSVLIKHVKNDVYRLNL